MDAALLLLLLLMLWLSTGSLQSVRGQGVYGKRVTRARNCFSVST